MDQTGLSSVIELSDTTESNSVQQYIEIGSNTFLGTKDGMKYTLIQSSDNKFRLIEAPSDFSADSSIQEGSSGVAVKEEDQSVSLDSLVIPNNEYKIIKYISLKSEPFPCKGQGDEAGNSFLSPLPSSSRFTQTVSDLEKICTEDNQRDVDHRAQLTYTTLLSRQENTETLNQNSIFYSTSESPYYDGVPTFSTPLQLKPARYARKQRMQIIPSSYTCSPIPRARMSTPRQRRPRRGRSNCNTQSYRSSVTNVSTLGLDSTDYLTTSGSSNSGPTADIFNKSLSSINFPRVPNNTPNFSELDLSDQQKGLSLHWMPHIASRLENYAEFDPRASHNEKERRRRLRIKNACQTMRTLLPSVNEKTDNATVFEQAALFLAFMRDTVRDEFDIEFLEHNYIF